jgi:anaerobic ribonucleoside-triphosphate reductase activating protein
MRSAASSARTGPACPDGSSAEDDAGLRVGGLVPFTATDYPGKLSAVVFCQGCPWRCGYCHNPHLIPRERATALDWTEVRAWLESRRGLLDAVVFSGGEPLAQPSLGDAIRQVRALGFAIGLHTGAAYPRRLAHALPLVDWVGLDIKAAWDDYASVTGAPNSGSMAWAGLDAVLRSGVRFEVRTTVHPLLTPAASLERIACELAARGVTHWILQRFRGKGCADAQLVEAGRGDILDQALLRRLARDVPAIEVRG